MTKVLITGVAGGQGRLVARRLLQQPRLYRVSGIDRESWPRHPEGLRFHQVDVRKKGAEDVIRTERPDVIVHFGQIRHFDADLATRHEVNVNGTRRLLDFALRHGVKQFIVFSSSYVYGALPENPSYMDESYPLSASRTYPEVRDLTEVDMLATAYLWQYPKMAITILRPVNVLGPHVHSSIGRYLRRPYVPTIVGFNPMLQFLHEDDMTQAIVVSIQKRARGIFNVVGAGAVPLSVAIEETGGTAVPVPEFLIRPVVSSLFRFGMFGFPPRAMDFIKYPCTLDGTRFSNATGFTPTHSLEETFASIRR